MTAAGSPTSTSTSNVPRVVHGYASDVPGFRFLAGHAGIKIKRDDLALIVSDGPAHAAAVFTTNKVCAAPVIVSREHLAKTGGVARAIVVNSGCANAATGARGLDDARLMAATAATVVGAAPEEVIVSSTGVIGRHLPTDKIVHGIKDVAGNPLSAEPGRVAAAMMTTDLVPKEVLVEVAIRGAIVRIGGVAKGSGMIHPNMATMLAFLVTDADVASPFLQTALKAATESTFNMISVDGDTSTNDMAVVLANGRSGVRVDPGEDPEAYERFAAALDLACRELAICIARDGEGANCLLEVRVTGAQNLTDARLAARSIVKSSLVKTAMFGRDPNWGRIVAAAGYSGAEVDIDRLEVSIRNATSSARLVTKGEAAVGLDLEELKKLLASPHVVIQVDLNLGSGEATAWGCDMSYDYVKINAAYTT